MGDASDPMVVDSVSDPSSSRSELAALPSEHGATDERVVCGGVPRGCAGGEPALTAAAARPTAAESRLLHSSSDTATSVHVAMCSPAKAPPEANAEDCLHCNGNHNYAHTCGKQRKKNNVEQTERPRSHRSSTSRALLLAPEPKSGKHHQSLPSSTVVAAASERGGSLAMEASELAPSERPSLFLTQTGGGGGERENAGMSSASVDVAVDDVDGRPGAQATDANDDGALISTREVCPLRALEQRAARVRPTDRLQGVIGRHHAATLCSPS